MIQRSLTLLTLAGVLLALVSGAGAQSATTPEITAQGFDIVEPRSGDLGHFGRIRLRFEVPERIAELRIRERSYEVDLANTLESSHFNLFGLGTRVRNQRDVTLNFQNYINRKLDLEGRYAISIEVKDKEGQSVSATLAVIVTRKTATLERPADRPEHVEHGVFSFQRVGAGPVTGTEAFGITWKTIEDARVVIQIARTRGGATKLLSLAGGDYESIETRVQLAQRALETGSAETIELATAGNGAAGETFAVVNFDKPYVLRVNESNTAVSDRGTTVTLRGVFKH